MSDELVLVKGEVKWFSKEKGYGFIQVGSGLDVFVHANQLKQSGIETTLQPGEKLSFIVEKGKKGTFASNIKRL